MRLKICPADLGFSPAYPNNSRFWEINKLLDSFDMLQETIPIFLTLH